MFDTPGATTGAAEPIPSWMPGGAAVWDASSDDPRRIVLLEANEALLGADAHRMIGQTYDRIFPEVPSGADLIVGVARSHRAVHQVTPVDGPAATTVWMRTHLLPLVEGQVVMLVDDVTAVVEAARPEPSTASPEEPGDEPGAIPSRLVAAFNQAPFPIAVLDTSGRIIDANQALSVMFGYNHHELLDRSWQSLSHENHPGATRESMERATANGPGPRLVGEWQGIRADGSPVWATISVTTLSDEGDQYLMVHLTDITALKHHQFEMHDQHEFLVHRALHDPLTGLPNRAFILEHLDRALARSDRTQTGIAVLFLDLDGFKAVNDTYGHFTGDQALVEAGKRMEQALRGSDVVGRLAGDEFIVVCELVQHAPDASGVAQRVLDAVSRPFLIDGIRIDLGASIGIAVADQASTVENLIQSADAALYEAKRQGRGRFVVADPPG